MHRLSEAHAWLLLLLAVGLCTRLAVAPYTSGSDIPQFAGFADTFLRHGIDFYRYVTGDNAAREGWAYPWPYVYGPLTILLLAAARLVAPGEVFHGYVGRHYVVYAPRDWIVASKAVFIAGDALSAVLVYLLARELGARWRTALAVAAIYFLNPMTIYISAVYGMIDPVMLAPLLAGLLALHRRRLIMGGALIGVALAIKPTAVYVLPPLITYYALRRDLRGALAASLAPATLAGLLYAPFLARPGALREYIEAVRSVACPCYTVPVVYSFNGIMSIAFYAWNHAGVNTSYILGKWPLLFVPAYLAAIASARGSRSPIVPAGLGYIVYTGTYWRVNHQYLVPTVAFAALILVASRSPWTRRASLLLALLIGLWPIMYPISFWAHVHIRAPNVLVIQLLDAFSLAVLDDLAYVYYSLALTLSHLLLIALASLEWAAKTNQA